MLECEASLTPARGGMQDSNFREIRRLTNLLLKLKRHELRMEAARKRDANRTKFSGDVLENTGT